MQTLLYVLHFLVCFILIAVVLLQRGKGQDLGASLGGGGANTIFGSRGAGNFLTRITTASAIIFMATSLSLSYLGYKSSDVRLFDESEPFVPAGAAPKPAESTLEEQPSDAAGVTGSTGAADAAAAPDGSGALVEIPADSGVAGGTPPSAVASAAEGSPSATPAGSAAPSSATPSKAPDGSTAPAAAPAAAAESAPAATPATAKRDGAEPAATPQP